MMKKLSNMSKKQKIAIKAVMIIAGLLLTLYTAFWGMLIAAFAGERFFSVLIPLTILVFFTLYCVFLVSSKKRKIVLKISIAVAVSALLLSAAKIIYTKYDESIPTVSVMDFDLAPYLPFEGAKRITADRTPSFKITEDYPVLDGAVAMFPVYGAFAEAVYSGLKTEQVSVYRDIYRSEQHGAGATVMCSNTPFAYENLIDGVVDIIFTAAPSARQIEVAQTAGKELTLTAIGKEAFVFFVNKNNPVDNLTLPQVKGIYSGRIKNWKEVGGRNKKIKAFQRPEGSGSQSALERLMNGDRLMPAPKKDRPAGMGGIISMVADYKNYGDSIGFSFRFFLEGMTGNKDVKILKINGIYPSKENIKNGSYPLSSYFYAVTAGSKNPNTEKFIQWILSRDGQMIVEKAGYAPVS